MREGYTIGQVASCSDVTVDTVRIYERQGLIEIPERRSNGYRHYFKKICKPYQFYKMGPGFGFYS